jgi:hypothetical protein
MQGDAKTRISVSLAELPTTLPSKRRQNGVRTGNGEFIRGFCDVIAREIAAPMKWQYL